MATLRINYKADFHGSDLKKAREELNYTRAEFAKKCGLDEADLLQLERPRKFYLNDKLIKKFSRFFVIDKAF